MATHTHDDTVTENPSSTDLRTITNATTPDPLAKRVSDFLARPARTSIQEYLRINAAASYLKAVREGGDRQPVPTKPSPHPTTPGKKAAACIAGALVDNRLNSGEKKKGAIAAAVRAYMGAHYPQHVGMVVGAFDKKTDPVPIIRWVVENVEDKEGKPLKELLNACTDDGC